MKYFNVFLICHLFFVSLIFTSCAKEEINNVVDSEEVVPLSIQTTSFINSRSVKQEFSPGDQLGLYLVKKETGDIYDTDGVFGNNLCSTLSGNHIWEHNVDLSHEKLHIYAYYPYTNRDYFWFPEIRFSLNEQIPLLFGTHSEHTIGYVDNKNPSTHLTLKHITGVAEFFVRKNQDFPGTGKLTEIKIYNNPSASKKVIPTEFYFDIKTQDLFAPVGDQIPTVLTLDNFLSTSYPQEGTTAMVYTTEATKKKGDILISFKVDDKSYIWELPVGTHWEGNHKYTYYITVIGGALSIESAIVELLENGDSIDVELQ